MTDAAASRRSDAPVVVVGATGDLGGRVVRELVPAHVNTSGRSCHNGGESRR